MARMKHAHPSPISQDSLEAFIASALLGLMWLMGVILKLAAPHRSRRLVRFVKFCERWVERAIFLRARLRLPPAPTRRGYPLKARPGFRRQRGRKRLFLKSARIRARSGASLCERVARLLAALTHSERYILRFLKRLAHGLHGFRPLAVRPPAVACTTLAAPRAAICDSS
jgi:hypothetical protein